MYTRSEEGLGKRGDQWTEVLSWEPRAFAYHNFLSKEECEYLINLAKPHMVKSTVVDSRANIAGCEQARTFLWRGRDKIVKTLRKELPFTPLFQQEYGEEAHAGRYGAVSMPDQVTGRCFLYRMRLASQTSSQICPGTLKYSCKTTTQRSHRHD
ncbi:hypothetical protein Bca52824_080041 [Brassica carinata]|uniref:Uncharacterized protein n=1 Tax=Brassica carinata TaxID=52824 RepID=A0A8X7TZV6_BRACI|nr:hypothetical protein Bca52824_080041 [Brassica carinata]